MTVKRIGLLALLMCVVVVGAVIGLRGQAKPPAEPQASDERIVSGSDLGFRIEGRNGPNITGTLMVRIQGRWVPVNGPGTVPLTSR